ncbi:MAG: DUF6504 family protein [Nocardiopsaceae bacterium]|nr:DUF6504 family protein [Nocardiopsaceae bacterium]
MSEVRSDPVDVWVLDGRPARFVWRDRLYSVLSILARPRAQPARQEEHEEEREQTDARATSRCWTVTASVGRNVPATIYRLCQDAGTGRWLLTRIGR